MAPKAMSSKSCSSATKRGAAVLKKNTKEASTLGRRGKLERKRTSSKELLNDSTKRSGNGVVVVNRAPVLTLWMSVALRRLGYPREVALGAAKVITSRCAVAKGKSLGLFSKPDADIVAARKARREAGPAPRDFVQISGHKVPLIQTPTGLRALDMNGRPVDPTSVDRYLQGAFKANLQQVETTMARMALKHSQDELKNNAFRLYESFRPAWKGWGARSELMLSDIVAAGR